MNKTAKLALRVLSVVFGFVIVTSAVMAGLFYFWQIQMFRDPVFDHQRPDIPALSGDVAILVFSKTNGYRHFNAIPAGNETIERIAGMHGWATYFTENGAVFNSEQLARFKAVVWNNATGNLLTDAQRQALQDYIEGGGGFVAIHSAGDNSHKVWPWYLNEVIRAEFIGHTMIRHLQEATVHLENLDHPVLLGIEPVWQHTEEWYSFAASPRDRVTVLATVDESTYHTENVAMGADHPVIWAHEQGKGRVVYSALGHSAQSFADPVYPRILGNAIAWTARVNRTARSTNR